MHRNRKWWIDPAVQFDNLQLLFQNYSTKPILVEKVTVQQLRASNTETGAVKKRSPTRSSQAAHRKISPVYSQKICRL